MRHLRAATATALTITFLGCGLVTGTASATTVVSGQARATKELRALETSFKGRIGAYAIDTANGRTIAYRSDERFPLLSTFKAMACAAVLHKARTSQPGLMNKRVRWTARDLVDYSPVTEKHVKDGMTVAGLCHAAITMSDNTAGNLILKQIGGPAGLTRYFRSLKDRVSRLDRWETELNDWTPKSRRDTTTPSSIARDLRAVTYGKALNAKDRARLNAWLIANKTGDARIRAGLPKTWLIGDKTGTNSDGFGGGNDIAVIWPKRAAAPIIMAIYTNRRPGLAADDKTIAKTAEVLARGLGRL
ncbi:class A beta-lactamase [Nonomuraea sp. KC401]|uniref:class A beta-lactamase n=1 Tax=unclassified Nonomuraea TaxID=2593643 RepID=UPI0010FCDB92|nr:MULTISPECIES: class A beta-lactamase [unclassified Nonomuraea]NBE97203.1 class A beta-lactamase [Nonomuraea sp. K271]TLF62335.1 class A beta-lactamase [Nonomuraea sp. KC401]